MSEEITPARSKPDIDPTTLATQAAASDPARSAWVSANAGSGKTFVLARRVIRLLLAGTDPARILCLTFTKAAAAEMAKRVFADLGKWTSLSDLDLSEEIVKINGVAPDARLLAVARRLFARALDTPGGLKIQTIHAFCERLLHQFPFEANVAGHFDVLDERDATALKEEARRIALADATDHPARGVGRALATVLSLVSDSTHEESVGKFIDSRDAIGAWIAATGTTEAAVADLRKTLGVGHDETAEALRREIIDGAPFDASAATHLVEHLRRSGGNDAVAAERLAPYATSADPDQRLAAWLDFFMTDGKMRKSPVTKKAREASPGLAELIDAEFVRLGALIERLRTAHVFESSAAMLRLADAVIAAYTRLKQLRGVLDFDDLVIRTAALLSRSDAARWVQYKLDRGLAHILVDEAQDTSPRQWEVIRALVEDFFAGEGAGPTGRTLFAVGDEKQSIFSFQGAVPVWFSRMRRELGARARAGGYPWSDLELHLSFRSAPVILEAVDAVFRTAEAHTGLAADPQPLVHQARRRGDPGRVVVWPAIRPPEKPEASDWSSPVDYLGPGSPEVQLARRIAATIRGWFDRGEVLEATGTPIRAGGILILARSRGALTDAINRELKRRRIPIAGADRLTLTEHIAVMDLMALGRVALLPDDDLSLAGVLKCPLIDLDEDALFALASGRKGSLWASLATKANERQDFAAARARLESWRAEADYRDPHAFFARILAEGGGRRAFLGRLGPEVEDVLDEFLAQALAYERTNVPSLEGFLAWLVAGETEIKRDTDTLRDEVRVMTVHGAKGLEADVVFLVDNGSRPQIAAHDPRVLPLADDSDPRRPGPLVWMRTIRQMPERVAERVRAARTRAEQEYRRLLYVAMTRAKDRLYVVGIANRNTDGDKGWHGLVTSALQPEWTPLSAPGGEADAYEWRAPAPTAKVATAAPVKNTPMVTPVPLWARSAAPSAPGAPIRLTPSSVSVDAAAPPVLPSRTDPAAVTALQRGGLVHRLLQSLPDIAPDHRHEVGAAYLAAFADEWTDPDRAELLAEVLAILGHLDFAEAFGPGSRAEVEIAGRLGSAIISGRIDRLAVAPERVLIVDYKTNRPPPEDLAAVPSAYITQLALYRAVLRRLYPDRAVAAALLWTDRPALMEIPEAALILAETALTGR